MTFDEISKLLRYEPETGKLFWRPRPVEMFASAKSAKTWNTRFAGKEALRALDANGYRHGQICGRYYRAHRIAWLLAHGEWPVGQIDHINGDPSDNRLVNLRCVSGSVNMRNAKRHGKNTSGVTGVCWDASRGQWMAQMQVDRKPVRLGRFDHFEEAVAARKAAEVQHGFHLNHGRAA